MRAQAVYLFFNGRRTHEATTLFSDSPGRVVTGDLNHLDEEVFIAVYVGVGSGEQY